MLTLEDTTTGLRASVAFDRWDGDRPQYRWTLEAIGMPEHRAEGDDLRLGSCSQPVDAEALRSLLDFFGAYAEAIDYERRSGHESDNGNLFPASLRDLASGLGSDTIAMLATEALGSES